MSKKLTTKSTRVTLQVIIAALMVLMLVFTSLGIYYGNRRRSSQTGAVNPLDWSIDEWDGESVSDQDYFQGAEFGNRDEKSITINSAASFLYFISQVNDLEIARQYDYFKDYTVYLNTNIDLKGASIDAIGMKVDAETHTYSTFQGVFDGGYYTIFNATINGNGLFNYVENATIQNLGLYNVSINSAEESVEYVGGIVAEAVNTDIHNTYVNHGSISGAATVGGIVGMLLSTDGNHYVTNSFADVEISGNTVGGIIGYANANHSEANTIYVSHSYFTGDTNGIARRDSDHISTDNFIKATSVSQFYSWDYAAEYNLEKTWCDYSYREGSTELSFNYPILTRFNKVFMTGSCYENTVKNETTGEIINAETIADAFDSVIDNQTAEVNIIVEKVFMEDTAVASGTSAVTLNTSVDTSVVRGDSNPLSLIVGTDSSTLVLGDENASSEADDDNNLVRTDDLPTIVLDGERERVTRENLTTNALVYSQGNTVEMYDNVILKNNVNNADGYGGAMCLNLVETETHLEGGQILNCTATKDGGGIYCFGNNLSTNHVTISNCSTEGDGGGVYFSVEEADAPTLQALSYLRTASNSKYVKPLAGQINTSGKYEMYGTSIYNNSATNGGGVYASEIYIFSELYDYGGYWMALTWAQIDRNTASNYGGGVYQSTNYGNITCFQGYITNNEAQYGGGVYFLGDFHLWDAYTDHPDTALPHEWGRLEDGFYIYNNTAYTGGGIYNGNNTPSRFHFYLAYYSPDYYSSTIYNNTATFINHGQNTFNCGYYERQIKYRTGSTSGYSYYQCLFDTYNPTTDGSPKIIVPSGYTYAGLSRSYTGGGFATTTTGFLGANTNMVTAGTANNIFTIYNGNNSTDSQIYYAVWKYDNNGTRTETSTYTHRFYRTPGSTSYTTTTTTRTREYTGVTRYLACDRSTVWAASTGGTAGSSTYSSLSSPLTFGTTVSGYRFEGWTTSTTSTSPTWTSGTQTPTSNTSYYAVWSDTNGTRTSSSSITHKFYTASGSYTPVSTTKTSTYTGVRKYYNYRLTSSTTSTTGGSLSSTSYSTLSYRTASKSGYSFEGWTTSSSGTTATWTSGSKTPSSATTYYAVWSDTSGTRSSTSTLTHTFYTTSGVSNTRNTTKTIPYTDVAKYYNYDLSSSRTATTGGLAGTPTYSSLSYKPASRSGYNFMGWTTSNTGTSATWTSGTQTPTGNTAYYAVWSRTLTLNHYATSSTVAYTTSNTVYCAYNGSITSITASATTSTPTLDGFNFHGWAASSPSEGGNSPTIYTSRTIDVSAASTTSNLYAVWSRSVHFYYNGTSASITRFYPYNTATGTKYISIFSTAPTGYTLYGYTNISSFTNNTTTAPSRISYSTNTNNIVTTAASTTVYAVYMRTWTFHVDGNTTETRNAYYMYNVGASASYSQSYSPTKSGYTFVGWTTSETGTTASSSNVSLTTESGSWYAVWRSNAQSSGIVTGSPSTGTATYTLTFNGNNNTSGSTNDVLGTINISYSRVRTYYLQYNYDLSISTPVGESYGSNYESGRTYPTLTLPSNGFIRTGYTFTTWALGSATGTTYAVGSRYTPTSGTSATMYAVWDANDYILTFNANGGTLSGNETYIVTYDSTNYNSMSSIIPTREGYTFIGWYTDATNGVQVYNANGQAVEGDYWAMSGSDLVWHHDGDVTLYAHWTARPYNVTTGISDGTASITVADIGSYGEGLSISWAAKEDTEQYTYTLDNVCVYAGTDTSGTLLATYTSGTSATYVMNGTYYENIYIYVTHTATVNRYDVTIVSNNTTYGTVSIGQVNVPYGSVVQTDGNIILIGSETVTATANTGYHFSSWTAPSTITGTTTITAVFAPDTDTAYTVRHYWQNVDDDEYTLHETENLTGATGAQVTPSVKTYTGFNSPSTQTVTIAADGSTVVEYRYTRQTYTVNLQTGTGVTSVSGGGTYRYEKEITINAVLTEGYDWRNWTGTTTISTQQATITVTQNMTLTANADIKVLVVTITAGTGGQVSETSVEVNYGTAVSVDGATLTIGTTVVTATANSGYEFDSYLNVPETVTSNVTITAQFAEIVNVTIEVQGEVGTASYGIKVNNGETISTSGTVRKGSTINIVGATEPGDEENNTYQLVAVYVNDALSMRPVSGTIDNRAGTTIESIESDTTIRFVFSEGYRMNISATEDTNVDSIEISTDLDKITADGIIATDAEVTITIDENTLKGSNTDRTYIGMIYTLESGETVSVLNGGDDYVHKDDISVGDGLFVYTIKENVIIEDIHVIVKGTEEIDVVIPEGTTVEIRSADEGFVRVLQNGTNAIFTGKWYIMLPIDAESIETIFSGYKISKETTGAYEGYHYFEL